MLKMSLANKHILWCSLLTVKWIYALILKNKLKNFQIQKKKAKAKLKKRKPEKIEKEPVAQKKKKRRI